MPKIDPYWLDSVVYVYRSEADARAGVRAGGSGFITYVRSKTVEPWAHLYVVTNDHVIRKTQTPHLRVNTKQNQFDVLPTEFKQWERSEDDDLAVIALEMGNEHKWHAIGEESFIVPERFTSEKIKASLGDEVALMGRFISYEGKQRNKPTVRFGNLSMVADPDERIVIGKKPDGSNVEQEAFLVECRSLSGYSGSPVLIFLSNQQGQTIYSGQLGPLLLGVDCAHFSTWKPVCSGSDDKTTGKVTYDPMGNLFVDTNSGIAAVVPAWRLRALLDREVFMKQRKDDDAELTRKHPRDTSEAVPDVADDQPEGNEFTRADFESALKRVSRKLSGEEKSET